MAGRAISWLSLAGSIRQGRFVGSEWRRLAASTPPRSQGSDISAPTWGLTGVRLVSAGWSRHVSINKPGGLGPGAGVFRRKPASVTGQTPIRLVSDLSRLPRPRAPPAAPFPDPSRLPPAGWPYGADAEKGRTLL